MSIFPHLKVLQLHLINIEKSNFPGVRAFPLWICFYLFGTSFPSYGSRVGRGWQKLVFATGFNRFKPAGRNPQWQKLAKTQMTKTVGFLVSNCFKCTNVCLDGVRTYCALNLIGFLVGDYLKCTYMVLITIGICFSAYKVGCILLYS